MVAFRSLAMLLSATMAFANPLETSLFTKRQSPLNCVGNAVSSSDLTNAVNELIDSASGTSGYISLGAWQGVCVSSGAAEFYICNNSDNDNTFHADDDFVVAVQSQYGECGDASFYYYADDNWSYGCDPSGFVE